MKTLSSYEINHVSGGFSTEKLLSSAELGAVVGISAFIVSMPFSGLPFIPCLTIPIAGFVGLALLHEAAASFDRHYGHTF